MRKNSVRLICLLLAVCVLGGMVSVSAAREQYTDISGHWAEADLIRAAEDGYMQGDKDKMMPNNNINRAQASAIINRILDAAATSDISEKTDVPESAWYRTDLEKAAYLGYLASFDRITSEKALKRSEVFTILGRAFGLCRAEPDMTSLNAFSDVSGLKGEFRRAAASFAEADLVQGNAGKLNPDGRVTRAEFMSLMYRIMDNYEIVRCTDKSASMASGSGNTIVCCDSLSSMPSGQYGTAVIAVKNGNVSFAPANAKLVVIAGGEGTVNLSGNTESLDVTGNGRSVNISGTVGTLAVSGANVKVVLNYGARVGKIIVAQSAAGCSITGTGRVESAEVNSTDCVLSVKNGGNSAVSGGKVTITVPEILPAGAKLEVGAVLENYSAGADCDIQWYCNSLPGLKSTCQTDSVPVFSPSVKYSRYMGKSMDIGLSVLCCSNGSAEYRYETAAVQLENYPDEYYIKQETQRVLNTVITYQYPSTVNGASNTYSDSTMKTKIGTVQKGTAVTLLNTAGNAANVQLPGGAKVWIPKGAVTKGTGNYTLSKDYPASDKVLWVNGKNYASETEYLVWVSLACQKVNVFKGTAGAWNLIKEFPCASGAVNTPTPTGTYKITYRQSRWQYNTYYCGPITGIFNGYAFHSWLHTNDGGCYDYTMGRPASHGCLRMEDDGANYMYKLPLKTTVVIW